MARKSSSGGFSITSIIFMVVMYNVFFGGDDTDKNEVEVRDQDKPAIVETIKDAASEISVVVKEKGTQIIDQIEAKQETETETPPKEEPEETKSPVMVAEPETEETPEMKPIDDQPKEEGMKKL